MVKISYTSTKKVTLYTNNHYTDYKGERIKHTFASESTTVYKWNGIKLVDAMTTDRYVDEVADIRKAIKNLLQQGAKMEGCSVLSNGTKAITWRLDW